MGRQIRGSAPPDPIWRRQVGQADNAGMRQAHLIGREREVSLLTAAIDRAYAGSGSAWLVTGEAGVGKSTLVAHACTLAREQGALVLAGACWAGGGAPDYWPWVQVMRTLRAQVDAQLWDRLLVDSPAVQRLMRAEPAHANPVPAISVPAGSSLVPPAAADPPREAAGLRRYAGAGQNRESPMLTGATGSDDAQSAQDAFVLGDAVTTTICAIAGTRPVVIVVEDLHWADPGSLQLAEFLIQHAALDPVCLVATCRDEDPAAMREVVGRLGRARLIPVTGLGADDVGSLFEQVSGRSPDAPLLAELCARTGGNPFFVEQTAALWEATSSLHTVPLGVREVIERRLAHLPTESARLLEVAALWGADFDRDVVLASAAPPASIESFDPATPGLVRRIDGARMAFVHDLVREVLVSEVPPADRRRLHARAVRALAGNPALAARILPSQLAERAHLAGPELADEEATPILLEAAEDAAARMAAAESARLFARALDRIPGGQPQRLSVGLALGNQHRAAGELAAARATFELVHNEARNLGALAFRAEAALGLHRIGFDFGDDQGWLLMDEVLAAVRADPDLAHSALAARVMAAAARDIGRLIGADRQRAERLGADAIELARACGDDEALGLALVARHDTIWAPGTAVERLDLAAEIVEVARRLGDSELELLGVHRRVIALLELGDPRANAEHVAGSELAERLRLPRALYVAAVRQATFDTLQGRLAEARHSIDAAAELGALLGAANHGSVRIDQLFQLAQLTGRYDELEPLVRSLRAQGDPHVLVLEVTMALRRGETTEPLKHEAEVVELGRRWPRWGVLLWLSLQAEVAVASGDPGRCRRARADLAPWRDLWVVLGGAVMVGGPLRLATCTLDIRLAEWEAAVESGSEALAAAERISARPWVVLGQLHLAEALIGRGGPGDLTRAADLVAQAGRDAQAMGMEAAASRAKALTQALGEVEPEGAGASWTARPDGDAADSLHFDGSVWTVRFRGRVTLLPDAKGLHDLRTLLSHPGVDIPVRNLLDPGGTVEVRAATMLGADPVLDETAKAAFRHRIRQLDAALADAEDEADDQRAQRVRQERGAIIAELVHATGLGGRDRRLGDASERARKAVSGRIRDVIRRLGSRDPELAAHLQRTVVTGLACSYRPEAGQRWSV